MGAPRKLQQVRACRGVLGELVVGAHGACPSIEPGKNQRALARRSSEMPRLLAELQLLCDEGERGLGHLTPTVINRQGMPATLHFTDLRDRGIALLEFV